MSVQYYGSTHLEPNMKYTIHLNLPGIIKHWSFISQLVTSVNEQALYCSADLVQQDLRQFTDILEKKDIYFAIKDASDRLEDFMIVNEIEIENLYDTELKSAKLAMKNYTRFKAGVDLANQVYHMLTNRGGREAKRLGNLQIDVQGPMLLTDLNKLRQHLLEQLEYWQNRLLMINTESIRPRPRAVVRGNTTSPYSLNTRTF